MRNRDKLFRKTIIFSLVFLLVGASVISVKAISGNIYKQKEEQEYDENSYTGNIFYVGGTGEGNYSSIQEAINNASSGDTIYVYHYSSPYIEHVVIDKSIMLKGENKENTVIDGEFIGNVVSIARSSSGVIISGFTIKNSGPVGGAGIMIDNAQNIIIQENIIKDTDRGIFVDNSKDYQISINDFYNNNYGVCIKTSDFGFIGLGNYFENNKEYAIYIEFSFEIDIKLNEIKNNSHGLYLTRSWRIRVENNNFIDNKIQANFTYIIEDPIIQHIPTCINKYRGNYWSDSNIPLIYIISGSFKSLNLPYLNIRLFQIDWNKKSNPNQIP